jgi:hypothetical protein
MIKRILTLAAAIGLSFGAFASCSNDPTLTGSNTTGSNLSFVQLDKSGNAGLTEIFTPYTRHDASNRAGPLADESALQSDITTFVTGPYAGRTAGIASFIANLLAPDVMVFDYSQTANGASYLGVETNGQINDYCSGSRSGSGTFGGRSLYDDVASETFGLIWGTTVPVISLRSNVPNQSGAVPDDLAEKDGRAGRPNLTTDNVGCGDKHFTLSQFPYLGAPH